MGVPIPLRRCAEIWLRGWYASIFTDTGGTEHHRYPDKPVDEKLTVKGYSSAAEVDAAIKQAYKDILNKYSLPGFPQRDCAPHAMSLSCWPRQFLLRQPTIFSAPAEPQLLEA